MHQDMNELR